jgi:hypothetical protein
MAIPMKIFWDYKHLFKKPYFIIYLLSNIFKLLLPEKYPVS